MRSKKLLQKTAVWFLCLLLYVTYLSFPVSAYTSVNTQQKASLRIHFSSGEKGFANVTFRLYKVAELSASGSYTLTGDFKNYPVQLEHLESEEMGELAETLSAYVERDKLTPIKEETTDAAGQLKFSELSVGLYLILGENHQENTIFYSPVPQLLTLPYLNENNHLEYDVVTFLKYEFSTNQGKTEQLQQTDAPDSTSPENAVLDSTLPQTGVLWWPVPVLAAVGMLLFLVGWRIAGLLLLVAAVFLTGYNLWDENRAMKVAGETVVHLEEQIPKESIEEMEMPIIESDEEDYIGILEIPVLERKLPVISEWSYPKLRNAPCRYTGSVYQDTMIIAAHNYRKHFGNLENLRLEDEILFTDAKGKTLSYEVVEIEVLHPEDVEEMQAGDWDLTLFTCTLGGQRRITVRCERKRVPH